MSAITNRYARVFADILLDKRLDRPKTAEDLALFAQMIKDSHELRSVWQNALGGARPKTQSAGQACGPDRRVEDGSQFDCGID